MIKYKTSLGTIVVSKLKDIPIKDIKLSEELWYELPKSQDSYYVSIVPKKPVFSKGLSKDSKTGIVRKFSFYIEEVKSEPDVLSRLQKRLKSYVSGFYPQVLLDIISEAITKTTETV